MQYTLNKIDNSVYVDAFGYEQHIYFENEDKVLNMVTKIICDFQNSQRHTRVCSWKQMYVKKYIYMCVCLKTIYHMFHILCFSAIFFLKDVCVLFFSLYYASCCMWFWRNAAVVRNMLYESSFMKNFLLQLNLTKLNWTQLN